LYAYFSCSEYVSDSRLEPPPNARIWQAGEEPFPIDRFHAAGLKNLRVTLNGWLSVNGKK
jgi:hypothetical protein